MNYQKVYITDKPSTSQNQPPPRPKATYKRKLTNERYSPIYIENAPNEFNVSPPKINKPKPPRPPKTYLNDPKLQQYTKVENKRKPKPPRPPKTYLNAPK